MLSKSVSAGVGCIRSKLRFTTATPKTTSPLRLSVTSSSLLRTLRTTSRRSASTTITIPTTITIQSNHPTVLLPSLLLPSSRTRFLVQWWAAFVVVVLPSLRSSSSFLGRSTTASTTTAFVTPGSFSTRSFNQRPHFVGPSFVDSITCSPGCTSSSIRSSDTILWAAPNSKSGNNTGSSKSQSTTMKKAVSPAKKKSATAKLQEGADGDAKKPEPTGAASRKTATSSKKGAVKGSTASPKKKASPKRTAKGSTKKKTKEESKQTSKQKTTKRVTASDDDASSTSSSAKAKKTASPKKKRKTAAADHQRITDRDEIPKLWSDEQSTANGSYTFKIASWNVAGLRALVKKQPTALADLCKKYDLDMLCLQETKLQDVHVDDPKLAFRGCLQEHGYEDYWSCSTAKKGYSGTAVFVKQHTNPVTKKTQQTTMDSFFSGSKKNESPTDKKKVSKDNGQTELLIPAERLQVHAKDVTYKIGKEIDNEGRTITVDFPFGTFTNVYVPNAGQSLQRLTYRTEEWDKDFLAFQQAKETDRKLPVIWLGDLNIAHKARDVWNDGAKHLAKQAGVTPQERASFQEQLDSGGYIDAFRYLHPTAKGHYSYWSMRAGNREPNKGLRLDYFICSPGLFKENSNVIVRDSYMARDQQGSDHCPVILELEVKAATS